MPAEPLAPTTHSRTHQTKGLIVLLGHQNDVQGELSRTAMARCDVAAQIAKERPGYLVLPTGAFGHWFNLSPRPHARILKARLVALGVPEPRILAPAPSAGTVEDALTARRIAVGLKTSRIVVVSSAYHMARVKPAFGRIFPEFDLEYVDALGPDDSQEALAEAPKARTEAAQWVDVPLFGAPPSGEAFPVEIYDNASNEQKHYDRLSYFILGGQFAVFAFPYAVGHDLPVFIRVAAILLSAFFIWPMFFLYLRTAVWANTGRRVMYLIEAQWGQPGFSYNARQRALMDTVQGFLKLGLGMGFVRTFTGITCAMTVAQVAAALWMAFFMQDVVPNPPALAVGATQPSHAMAASPSTSVAVGAGSTAPRNAGASGAKSAGAHPAAGIVGSGNTLPQASHP